MLPNCCLNCSRGAIKVFMKNNESEIADLTKAIELNEDPGFYRLRAEAYEKMGDKAKSAADRAKAEELQKALQPKQK